MRMPRKRTMKYRFTRTENCPLIANNNINNCACIIRYEFMVTIRIPGNIFNTIFRIVRLKYFLSILNHF